MKKALIILIIIFVSSCSKDYSKKDIIGDWTFTNMNNEDCLISFTSDSIFTNNKSIGYERKFIFELKNDSILMLININGVPKLADYGIIKEIDSESITIEKSNHITILRKKF